MAEDFSFFDANISPDDEYDAASFDQPSYDQSSWGGDQGGFDMGFYDDVLQGYNPGQMPQQQQWMPEQSPTSLVQEPGGAQGFDQRLATEPGPSVGQQGAGGGNKEDDWLKMLGKAGIGMGVGAGTSALGSLVSGAMAPRQRSQSSPVMGAASAQSSAVTTPTYTPEPLAPEPGTKASPLISGRPTSVRGSAGLAERRPGRGGFSIY